MPAIPSIDALLEYATTTGNGELRHFYKDQRILGALPAAVPYFASTWLYDGTPSAGVLPGAVARNPTNATAGALKQRDAAVGKTKWLTHACIVGALAGSSGTGATLVYDRLFDFSGLVGNITTAQLVGGAVTRYTGAESAGNEIWVEYHTAIGATASTIVVGYTNQAGVAGRLTVAEATQASGMAALVRLTLQAGDTGVRSIESVTLSASTGTAGNFAVVIARPLLMVPTGVIGTIIEAGQLDEPIEIKDGACLAYACRFTAASAQAPQLMGSFFFVDA